MIGAICCWKGGAADWQWAPPAVRVALQTFGRCVREEGGSSPSVTFVPGAVAAIGHGSQPAPMRYSVLGLRAVGSARERLVPNRGGWDDQNCQVAEHS